MVKTLAVDKNNDLYLDSNGNLSVVTELEAVLQSCAQSVKAITGQLLFNTERGMPNFKTIWDGDGAQNIPQYEAAWREIVKSNPDVKEILQLEFTQEDNQLKYVSLILTTFGIGRINGQL